MSSSTVKKTQTFMCPRYTDCQSNFEKVRQFNRAFGVHSTNTPFMNVFMENPKLTNLRLSLIQEEVKELEVACKEHDFTEVADAIGDILYVVYGMADSFGINADEVFNRVHKSNMSKLCVTEEEAIETVDWYKSHDTPYDSPAYRKSDDGKYWVVFNESTGKILKNIHYSPVKFDDMWKNADASNHGFWYSENKVVKTD